MIENNMQLCSGVHS